MTEATEQRPLHTEAGRASNGVARRIDTSERAPQDSLPATRDQLIQSMQIELAELRGQVARQTDESKALVTVPVEPPISTALPVMSIQDLKDRDQFIKDVVENFFQEGIHFGVPFPNAKDKDGKPIRMLYKIGAEWFASAFGVRQTPVALEAIVERGEHPYVFYRYRVDLVFIRTGQIVGSHEGVCSSEETAYKYRSLNYKCPLCGKETIKRSKQEYGGGWYCNKKDGGCSEKFGKDDPAIMDQPEPKKILNPDVIGEANNIADKAQKRGFVGALKAAYGLGVAIKYFEGLDFDREENGEPPVIINGQPIPPRTAKAAANARREQEAAPNTNGCEDAHWSLKPELRGNFDRAMSNNSILEPTIKNALGAETEDVTLSALLLNYSTVGEAIAAVLTYVKEHIAS